MSGPYAPTDLRTDTLNVIDLPDDVPRPSEWTVPPGTVEQAAKAAEPEVKATTTDALAQDANPPEYPAGAPELRALMRLPRRQRGQFFARIEPLAENVKAMPGKGTEAGPAEAARMYETLADVEDLLRDVAIDVPAYEAWLAQSSDADLMQLFVAYFARTQVGEVKSSSS